MARGTVKVRSVNGALTVTFTTASGRTPTVYSDSALTTTQTLPATVDDGATGTFYFASPGAYTMSVKTATGIQIAADLNTTRVINVDHGQTTAYDYDTRLVSSDASGDSGRHSPGKDLSATYRKLKTVDIDVVQDYSAVGDGVFFPAGGSITTGTKALTLTAASGVTADVGKKIIISGAGAAGAALVTTITAASGTSFTVNDNAGTTVSGASVAYGTDDTAAFQNAIADAASRAAVASITIKVPTIKTSLSGGALAVGASAGYLITSTLTTFAGLTIEGVTAKANSAGGPVILAALDNTGLSDWAAPTSSGAFTLSGVVSLFQMGTQNAANPYDYNGTGSYAGPEGFNLKGLMFQSASPHVAVMGFNGGSAVTSGQFYAPGLIGVLDWYGGHVHMEDVRWTGFDLWLHAVQSDFDSIDRVQVRNCRNGFYLGPGSDQASFYDLYPVGNDRVGVIDCAKGATFQAAKWVDNGRATVAAITVTSASFINHIPDNIVFFAPWFEHTSATVALPAFLDIGIQADGSTVDTAGVGAVKVLHPVAWTQASPATNRVTSLVRLGNASYVDIDISAKGTLGNLSGSLVTNISAGAPLVRVAHPWTTHQFGFLDASNTGGGSCDPLFVARGSQADSFTRKTAGVNVWQFGRTNEDNPRLTLDSSGVMGFGPGVGNPVDVHLKRTGTATLGVDAAFQPVQFVRTRVASSVSGAVAIDAATGNVFVLTLTGDVTSTTVSNAATGQPIEITVAQDGTGGRAMVWPANVIWTQGGPPVNLAASSRVVASFTYDGTNLREVNRSGPVTDPFGFGVVTHIPFAFPGSASAFPAANQVNYYRLVAGGQTISKVRTRIGTQSGNIGFAYYANSGSGLTATPGAQLATTGSVACPAAGTVNVSLTGSCTPNVGDWCAIWADNTTVTFWCPASGTATTDLYGGRATFQTAGAGSGPPATPSGLSYGVQKLFDFVGAP